MTKISTIILGLLFLISAAASSETVEWGSNVVSYSSYFYNKENPKQYRPEQILGEPSAIPGTGFSSCAFTPSKKSNDEPEYIEVGFENPIQAVQVAINENINAGAISSVIIKGDKNQFEQVYKDTVNNTIPDGRTLNIYFDKPDFNVTSVYIELNTSKSDAFNQLDAVAISDSKKPVQVKINLLTEEKSELISLGKRINSTADEMLPVISPDGNSLYIVRQNHPGNLTKERQNIWKFDLKSDSPGELFPEPVNKENTNSAILSVTPDGQRFLLLNVYQKNGRNKPGVSFTDKTKGGFTYPEEVKIKDFYNDSQFGEYNLSNTGNIIVMAVKRDDTYGSKDLYVCFRNEDSTWTAPLNLGPDVNTAASEISPFLSSDSRTLYFTSTGHPGYGKEDIFMSRRIGKGWQKWTKPVNMDRDINSADFDGYLSIPARGDYMYLSSYKNPKGRADIFKARIPKKLAPEAVTLIRGIVRNSKTNQPISASISYYSLETGEKVGTAQSDPETGEYQITLPSGSTYSFSAEKEGFLPNSSKLEIKFQQEYQEIEKDLYLTPIEKGAKIVLNNIYFELGNFTLTKSSYVELDKFCEILKKNKNKVLVTGHTDDIGTKGDNQLLSEKRAKAVIDYMHKQGIEMSRLDYKGMGESMPIVENNSEENRQKNRRVEFEITEIE